MANHRVVPGRDTLAHWVEDGLTIEEMRARILEETGRDVPSGTLTSALSRAGLTQRVRYDDVIPWKRIAVEHNMSYILQQLRTAARLKRGLPVRDGDKRRHEKWLTDLEEAGAIVAYDPDTVEGFYYAKRAPRERGLARP